ncbi:hypothetical protein CRI94_14405 [Longibacter salinarum]|uniref:Uncharacterized protein n=1 Tax=Longibacter salinarum TaxID=1850348 RepID=A0A2A8CUV0_9BACT|nr:hypothetical protein [Longibacter salinarum]PEN12228.1 hypothetical protein CRI94_14405 [Longibacter salinarum]
MMTYRTGLHVAISAAVALVATLIIHYFSDATLAELMSWFVFFAFIQFGVVRKLYQRRCERCSDGRVK